MRILVDADSCPVKRDILELASIAGCPVVFVSSPSSLPGDTLGNCLWILAGSGPQQADLAILREFRPRDVVVCCDKRLAATVLQRGGLVLSPRGSVLTPRDLASRCRYPDTGLRTLRRGALREQREPYRYWHWHRFRHALSLVLHPAHRDRFRLARLPDGARLLVGKVLTS